MMLHLIRKTKSHVLDFVTRKYLAVIADLEEFLRAAMHVADDGVGAHDPFAVEDDLETEHAVRGGVLGSDVEHHVV